MKRALIALSMVLLLTGMTSAQSDLQSIVNIKITKTEPITLKQLKLRVEAYQREMGRVMTVPERREVLDNLISERLVVQAADRDGIKVADSEVSQSFISGISQQIGQAVTEADFAQLIKEKTGMTIDDYMRAQNGMTLAEYKAFLKSQLLAQRYVAVKKQDQIQNFSKPADADIRAYYELNKLSFAQTDTMKLFLIIVPKGIAPAEAKSKVAEMQKQIKDSPSATADIRARSLMPNSGFQAGVMYISKNATSAKQLGISSETILKMFSLGNGDVTDITETSENFQCFIVQDKYPARFLKLDDIVKPDTTTTVYSYIKDNLTEQLYNKAVSDALAQIITELKKPENFQILKSEDDLASLLKW